MALLHPENLKKGDWVVVTEVFDEDDKSEFGFFFRSRRDYVVNGLPLLVLAYSDPFIAVSAPGKIFALDRRRYGLAKLNRQYVNVFVSVAGIHDHADGEVRFTKTKAKKGNPSRCVRCGNKIRKRFQAKPRPFWVKFCPDCGWTGDPVFTKGD